jgi:membrane peptidoglycan carboxypeptidase
MLGGSTLYQQIERNLVFKVTGREVFCCTNQNQRNLVFAEEVSG